jgi:hypothetical protein
MLDHLLGGIPKYQPLQPILISVATLPEEYVEAVIPVEVTQIPLYRACFIKWILKSKNAA